jgi:hypothetical protein
MGCCNVPEIQPKDINEKAPGLPILQARRFESIPRCWLVHCALAKHPCAFLFLKGAAPSKDRVPTTNIYFHCASRTSKLKPSNEDGIHFHITLTSPLPSAVCCGSEAPPIYRCPRSPLSRGHMKSLSSLTSLSRLSGAVR